MICVLRTSSVVTAEMPTLEPRLRIRLKNAVPSLRKCGCSVEKAIVGRIANRFDGRIIMAIGLSLTAVSLWWMTNFYLQMDSNEVVWSGLLQGIGTGCVFAPLSTIAFIRAASG